MGDRPDREIMSARFRVADPDGDPDLIDSTFNKVPTFGTGVVTGVFSAPQKPRANRQPPTANR